MDIPISVADEDRDSLILAHWLLAAVYKLSGGKTTIPVRKADAFKEADLGGFKGYLKKHSNYVSLKGDNDYWNLVQGAVNLLIKKNYLKKRENRGYVTITDDGIEAVNSDTEWNKKYYPPQ